MRKYISIIAFITFALCMCLSTYYIVEKDYPRATFNLVAGMFNYIISMKNKE